MNTTTKTTEVQMTSPIDYADIECEGCLTGEDCDGWVTETLKCPSRIPADREMDAYLDAVREYEDALR